MPLLNQIVSFMAVALLPITGAVATVSALFPGLMMQACRPQPPERQFRRMVSHRTAYIAHGTPINF